MPKFKVKDVQKIPSGEDGRAGRFDTLVIYELDPLRVHMVTIPKEKIDKQDIIDAVKEDIEKTKSFTEMEFEI